MKKLTPDFSGSLREIDLMAQKIRSPKKNQEKNQDIKKKIGFPVPESESEDVPPDRYSK